MCEKTCEIAKLPKCTVGEFSVVTAEFEFARKCTEKLVK